MRIDLAGAHRLRFGGQPIGDECHLDSGAGDGRGCALEAQHPRQARKARAQASGDARWWGKFRSWLDEVF